MWYLECLLCGKKGKNNLVEMQEHAMNEHGYTQDDHKASTKRQSDLGAHIYTFPDGKDWMSALPGGNFIRGL